MSWWFLIGMGLGLVLGFIIGGLSIKVSDGIVTARARVEDVWNKK